MGKTKRRAAAASIAAGLTLCLMMSGTFAYAEETDTPDTPAPEQTAPLSGAAVAPYATTVDISIDVLLAEGTAEFAEPTVPTTWIVTVVNNATEGIEDVTVSSSLFSRGGKWLEPFSGATLNKDGSVTIGRIAAATSYRLEFSYVVRLEDAGDTIKNKVTATVANGSAVVGEHAVSVLTEAGLPPTVAGLEHTTAGEAPLTTTASDKTRTLTDSETPLAGPASAGEDGLRSLFPAVVIICCLGILLLLVVAISLSKRTKSIDNEMDGS